MKFDFKLEELYDMTLKELVDSLKYRREGLGYYLWKNGMLNQRLKEYPNSPEDASPELFEEKKGIPMPDFLKFKFLKRTGGVYNGR